MLMVFFFFLKSMPDNSSSSNNRSGVKICQLIIITEQMNLLLCTSLASATDTEFTFTHGESVYS